MIIAIPTTGLVSPSLTANPVIGFLLSVSSSVCSLSSLGFSVVFICQKDDTYKTLLGNIMEMKARGASIIAIIEEGDAKIKEIADDYIEVPKGIPEVISPIPFVVPLQLLA